MSKEKRVIAENLSKWYGEIRGVTGVNIEIGKGIIGFIGPNGAGKSTLLHLLCGLLTPGQGSVKILGENTVTGHKYKKNIGIALQKSCFYSFMTVKEFLLEMLSFHNYSRKKSLSIAEEAIEKVNLTHKANSKIKTLSKGMKQCIKLAQAICHDPLIIYLDEVLAGCDPLVKNHLKNLIKSLGEAGKTVVLSSHNLKEIEAITQEVIIITRGQIIAQGNISDINSLLREKKSKILIEGKEIRNIAKNLLDFEDVVGIKFENENRTVVETADARNFYDNICRLIYEKEFWVERIEPIDENLQSIFDYLVEKRGI